MLGMYYKRYELQWRLSLFFSASILAGGFGGVGSLIADCPGRSADDYVSSFSPTL